jgi:hypothetical protein
MAPSSCAWGPSKSQTAGVEPEQARHVDHVHQ